MQERYHETRRGCGTGNPQRHAARPGRAGEHSCRFGASGISAWPSYLLKHLQALSKAGILATVPGPSGGYRLAGRRKRSRCSTSCWPSKAYQQAFRCAEIELRGPGHSSPARRSLTPCEINAAMLRPNAHTGPNWPRLPCRHRGAGRGQGCQRSRQARLPIELRERRGKPPPERAIAFPYP